MTGLFILLAALIPLTLWVWISDYYILSFFNFKLKKDKDYLIYRIKKKPSLFKFANQKLKGDKDVVLAYLEYSRGYAYSLRNVSLTLINDKEVALKAVQSNGQNLYFLPSKFQDDKELVFEAILNDPYALTWASERLQNDRETVLLWTTMDNRFNNKSTFKFVSVTLKSDKEVVMEHVKHNGSDLKFASEKLQGDIDVVLTAVKRTGIALEFASEKLRDDWEVVMFAYESDKESIKYASERLKDKIKSIKS